jgi:hypothetical protein
LTILCSGAKPRADVNSCVFKLLLVMAAHHCCYSWWRWWFNALWVTNSLKLWPAHCHVTIIVLLWRFICNLIDMCDHIYGLLQAVEFDCFYSILWYSTEHNHVPLTKLLAICS